MGIRGFANAAYGHGRIVDRQAGRVLCARATQPLGFLPRLRGLLGRAPLQDDEAWWFARCAAVHTCGMRFAIDVVHLDREGRIARIRASLAPQRVSVCMRGVHVVELGAGAASRLGLYEGQGLCFTD